MRVVDAHLHVWDPSVLSYPWLAEIPELNVRNGVAELAAAESFTGSSRPEHVFVQADCLPDQAEAEVDWVSSVAQAARIRAIVAFAPLELGTAVGEILDRLVSRPLVVGVRRLLQSEPVGFALDDRFLAGARELAARGLSFDACVVEHQLGDITALADAVPELSIVLDHLGKPTIGGDAGVWRLAITELARRPNVSCKISGLPSLTTPEWTAGLLRPYFDHCTEVFGADRLMYGSDWPASSPQTSYERWQRTVQGWANELSPTEAVALMGGTASAFYRFEAAAAA